ncbi:hypothetical protein M231_06922 [Tremella mesenterica]|uniref:ERCC1-like central domain-containing protein n=1 Tax=Tremella mesenterica TaxID=5217 RepID=A0A4Q1BAM0_TREME|nr:hypothetical protein M231_06922 [Tremella mesenterica]
MDSPGPSRPPVPGFQKASSLLGSMRNASGSSPLLSGPSGTPGPAETSGRDKEKTNEGGEKENEVAGKPVNRPVASKNAIVYNAVQRRNPVLQAIKNVGIEIGDVVADYQVGTHNGVLFLSLKYHRLHPEYIHQRIEKMRNKYSLRIMLILCDVNEHQQSLREISKIAIVNDFTVFVAWSNEEVAQYLTTFKAFEHKSADTLKERVHQTYHDQLQHVLTSGKKVNKTDADNLAAQFGSFANIAKQPPKVLANVKGLGAAKVTSLVDAFTKPFLVGGLKRDEGSKTSVAAVTDQRVAIAPERAQTNASQVKGDSETLIDLGREVEADKSDLSRHQKRGTASSRSPGLSPELRPSITIDSPPWADPLDDEDDDSPSAKRLKTS